MGQISRLCDVIDKLSELDSADTIYALEPWTEGADSIVAREPDIGGLPAEALDAGLTYFLEVSIAQDFLQDWLASLDEQPTPQAIWQRVIDYAINDA